MGKHDSAPTYGWVLTSWFNKWIVRFSLLLMACLFVAGWTIVARLDADCSDRLEYKFETFGYVTELDFSKSETCVYRG